MLDPPAWSRPVRRSTGPAPAGPEAPAPKLPEPPEFREHPFAPPGACVDCGRPVAAAPSVPRCWECARPLCADCFWHHRLHPADHLCSACSARTGASPFSRSGAVAVATTVSGGRAERPA